MRFGFVVDSSCDLPREFMTANDIAVLPNQVRTSGEFVIDVRDPAVTADFYARHLGEQTKEFGESIPLTSEEIERLFLEQVVPDLDYVVMITVTAQRSPIYQRAAKALMPILARARGVREDKGIKGPFQMRVIDSQSMFAGHGAVVLEAVRLLKGGSTSTRFYEELEKRVIPNAYGYMVPTDLYYLYSRAKMRGDKSVGFLSYTVGSTFDIKPIARAFRGQTGPVARVRHYDDAVAALLKVVRREMERGLLAPYLNISYGGDLADVPALPGYAETLALAAAKGVEVHLSPMSITAGINVGRGAFCLGFIGQPHEFG